eukprot:scaffold364573_cov16-Prasinocladus_malaysianus.AAC.1
MRQHRATVNVTPPCLRTRYHSRVGARLPGTSRQHAVPPGSQPAVIKKAPAKQKRKISHRSPDETLLRSINPSHLKE